MSTLIEQLVANDEYAQQSLAGLLSLRQKIESTIDKINEWLSEAEDTQASLVDGITITLPDTIAQTGEAVAILTAEAYRNAMDDEEAVIQLAVNAAGDTITATGAQVLDAVEEAVQSAQLQGEFIDYCMENEQVQASEFITNITNKFTFVTGEMASRFSSFLAAKDPLNAIQIFMSTCQNLVANRTTVGGNEYVTVTSSTAYTGESVGWIMFDQFVNTVEPFFEKLVLDIWHIGEFLSQVWDGVVKLVKWMAGKLFKPLTTRFEVIGPVVGIMDMPLFQFYVADYVVSGSTHTVTLSSKASSFYSAWPNKTGYQKEPINFGAMMKLQNTHSGAVDMIQFYADELIQAVVEPCFEVIDGQTYVRPYDILIQTPRQGVFTLRVGPTSDGKVIFSCFAQVPKAFFSAMTDKEIAKWIRVQFVELVGMIADEVPCLTDYDSSNMDNVLLWLVTSMFTAIDDQAGDDNYDLVHHLLYLDIDAVFSYVVQMFAFFGLPAYLLRHSQGLNTWWLPRSENPSIHQMEWNCITVSGDWIVAGPDGSVSDTTIPFSFASAYKPFLQRSLTPVLCHYQTLTEQASEAWHYVIAAVIAIAAVAITVKYVKFRKKRIALAESRRGAVDAKSWTMTLNPSDADIKAYNKMKRVANRTEKINGLLGLTSPLSMASNVVRTATSVSDMVVHTQNLVGDKLGQQYTLSENTDTNTTNIATLTSQIKTLSDSISTGVGLNTVSLATLEQTVSSLSTLCAAIKTLINGTN